MTARILVAMSGGVDSSVAAVLLEEAGHDVVGVTLRLAPCGVEAPTGSCCGLGEIEAAREVAASLGIPHHVWDAGERFEERVLEPAWRDYDSGHTPNPCIQCNAEVKLALLCERAAGLGAQAVATGHHARVEPGPGEGARGVQLLCGRDPAKDQSYFLYALSPEQLAMTHFPVGELTKPEVRDIAASRGLPSAQRPESQDACLSARGEGLAETLRLHFGAAPRPGPLLDPDGRELGRHPGIHLFTLGQRRGTGFAAGQRAYVSAIDPRRSAVTLTTRRADLDAAGLLAGDLRWLADPPVRGQALRCRVKVRYRSPDVAARLELRDDGLAVVHFQQPQRAVTPGQAAVLYDGERVLGGGRILETWPPRGEAPAPDLATST